MPYPVTTTTKQGSADVSISITDLSGNVRAYRDTPFFVDTIAPSSPLLDNISTYTNINNVNISGNGEVNGTVYIYRNDVLAYTGTVGTNGRFSGSITLQDGENRVYAKVSDALGNLSSPST